MTDVKVTDAEFFRGCMVLFLDIPGWPPSGPPEAALLQIAWRGPSETWVSTDLTRGHTKRLSDGRIRAILKLPPLGGALHAVRLEPLPGGGKLEVTKAIEARLSRLFPSTDAEYVAAMQSYRTRWGNIKTRHFLAEQVVRWFEGASEHRIGATLIMAYKAVELGDPVCLDEALQALDTAFGWARDLPADWHPRRNGEHLEISLLTARWHVEIALDRVGQAHDTLDRLRQVARGLTNHATAAYSASKGLLMLGWLEWRKGEEASAEACWLETVAMFKMAVRDADPRKTVLFRELTHSLEAAALAGICLRELGKPDAADMPSLTDILRQSLRVPERVQERLAPLIEAHLRGKVGA